MTSVHVTPAWFGNRELGRAELGIYLITNPMDQLWNNGINAPGGGILSCGNRQLSKAAPNWSLFTPFSCFRDSFPHPPLPHLCSPLSSGSRDLSQPEPVCRGLQGADVGLAVGERGGAPGVLLPRGAGHRQQGTAATAPWTPWGRLRVAGIAGSSLLLGHGEGAATNSTVANPVVRPDPSLLSPLVGHTFRDASVVGHCWSTWRRNPDPCPSSGTQEGLQEEFSCHPEPSAAAQKPRAQSHTGVLLVGAFPCADPGICFIRCLHPGIPVSASLISTEVEFQSQL